MVGDVVILEVFVICVFCIFVEVYVEVFVNNIKGGDVWWCNYVYYIFVGFDDDYNFIFVLFVLVFIEIEQQCYDSVFCCWEVCLILSGWMKLE